MSEDKDPKQEVEAARRAFERDFERFDFLTKPVALTKPLTLSELEAEQRGLAELRTRHLGKKSAIASAKSLIGRVPAEERPSFARLVQRTEGAIKQSIDEVKDSLDQLITAARIESESVDVTIPGRRARPGHLHPITLMRQRIEDIFVSLGYAAANHAGF